MLRCVIIQVILSGGVCGMVRGAMWGGLGLAMAAFRWVPGLAAGWAAIARRLLWRMHLITAPLPFPALELAAVAALAWGLARHRLLRVVWTAAALYALLWYPAYWADPPAPTPVPEAVALEALCDTLIQELDASPLRFASPFAEAGAAAGLPGALVKPVRYPEWMRRLGAAGLFSPWTGEALVDGGADPAYIPFTCVHELQHLRGIADEGAANLAAYRACLEYGGMFADSARIWALRAALTQLERSDPAAARRLANRMDAALARLAAPTAPRRPNPAAALLGLGRMTSDYEDFVVDLLN